MRAPLAVIMLGFCTVGLQADSLRGRPAHRDAAAEQSPARESVKQRLAGLWRLVSYETFSESGETRRQNFDGGRIMYDDQGNMSAQLMRSDRPRLGETAADRDRGEAYRTYIAYYGTYTLDPDSKSVVHHVEGSLNPNWVGTRLVRYYEFSPDGRRLMLSLKSGERVTATITWERLK